MTAEYSHDWIRRWWRKLRPQPFAPALLCALLFAGEVFAGPARFDVPEFLKRPVTTPGIGSQPRPSGGIRTVMIQMFEWPWKDLARECEQVLGPMEIAAVQVSPPQEHLMLGQNSWWERYQPVSYKLVSRGGTEAEFRDMVKRCQAVGVDVYVDVILNHMAGIREGRGFAGTLYTKYNHRGLFIPGDFNDCGLYGDNQIRNYKDRFELQYCELLGLADLKTSSPSVRRTLTTYLDGLVDMGVAGFRLDAAKHMPADDLRAIVAAVKKPVYYVSETLIGPGDPVGISEYTPFSDVNVFPYAYDLARVLRGGYLASWLNFQRIYPASDLSVVFVENHDTQREQPLQSLSRTNEPEYFKLAEVFMLTWPFGYPQLFSGYRFVSYDEGPPIDGKGYTTSPLGAAGDCLAPWQCEHRATHVRNLVRFRNRTAGVFTATKTWSAGGEIFAFSRGHLGFTVINGRATELAGAAIPTDLPDGDYCDQVTASGTHCARRYSVRGGHFRGDVPARTAIVLLNEESSK
ncbi:MAG: alpha-amylase family protein [Bdellovibrionaceae bacterium]|nr:alpha-amylase family protein [Pseudobdellovibrionaceae bacterium]